MGKPKKNWAHKYLNDTVENSVDTSISSSTFSENHNEITNVTTRFENFGVKVLPDTSYQVVETEELVPNQASCRPFPVRPVPTYNCGTDLSERTAELDPVGQVPTYNHGRNLSDRTVDYKTSHPPIFSHFYPPINPTVNDYKTRRFENDLRLPSAPTEPSNTSHNFDAIRYVTNHLSNIEITRIQGIDSLSNDSNSCASNTFSVEDTSNDLEHSTNDQKRDYVQDILPVNSSLNGVSTKSKTISKQKKPRARKG